MIYRISRLYTNSEALSSIANESFSLSFPVSVHPFNALDGASWLDEAGRLLLIPVGFLYRAAFTYFVYSTPFMFLIAQQLFTTFAKRRASCLRNWFAF
ncbi:hypothetical protein XA68_16758 [Ophiocordyceps unilateralis]|uniref:Uncharacterized protein n=1 Tax=Ophiocordyceps unilateralis TaxID=268505 RepID=A0A2A9P5N6_OPHUN|nr:hypothetical protein XA68_16758 [Ophiocordyceps unilateralis]